MSEDLSLRPVPRPTGPSRFDGCHLVGEISISYERIVAVFGEPATGFDLKSEAEWFVESADGTVGIVYDYKVGKTYLGAKGLEAHEITDWHIGGHDDAIVGLVYDALTGAAHSPTPEQGHFRPPAP